MPETIGNNHAGADSAQRQADNQNGFPVGSEPARDDQDYRGKEQADECTFAAGESEAQQDDRGYTSAGEQIRPARWIGLAISEPVGE